MSRAALAIRDAIFNRVENWPGYAEFKLSPHVTVQPENLPSLAVYKAGETERPDGDGNAVEPHFMSEITITFSVIRKAGEKDVLVGALDEDATDIKTSLLTDPTFVHFGGEFQVPPGETWAAGDRIYWDFLHTPQRPTAEPSGNAVFGFVEKIVKPGIARIGPLFEAITQINERPVFPQAGDQYFAELRVEMTFQMRTDYPPNITDEYRRMRFTTRQLGADPDSPGITTVVEAE